MKLQPEHASRVLPKDLEAGVVSSERSDSQVEGRDGAPGELGVAVSGEGAHYEVALTGELDLATAPRLREELVRLSSEAGTKVTVDLSGLEFVDSTGLSVLVTSLKRLREGGGDMALRSPRPGTMRVLEITGLTEVFAIS